MKVAMTIWEDSLSTVCDFCSSLLLFDVGEKGIGSRVVVPFDEGVWPARVNQLAALGAEVLLCGAISRPLERAIRAAGIQVIPYLRGAVDAVIQAYLDNALGEARFLLPGFTSEGDGRGGRGRWRGCHDCGRRTAGPSSPGRGAPARTEPRRKRPGGGKETRAGERMSKMRVAITAGGEGIDSPVDRVFGRAKQFIITDPDGSQVEVLENSQNVNAAQGAGIQAARLIADRAVEVLLTGNVGPNAFRSLDAASIRVYQFAGDTKTVRDALEAWKAGRLTEVAGPTAKGHGF